jgi:PucR C-terminal helix-turn-helix domain/GGDEF-like domain
VKGAADDSRRRLFAGVRSRRQEIGRAVLDRIHAIGPGGSDDPEYRDGLRLATEAAIDHTIESLEGRHDPDLSVPAPLLSQARLAARRRVPLEVVLRRYLAGSAVLGDFVMAEAERQAVSAGALRWVLRSQAATTDLAVATISTTYLAAVTSARPRSMGQQQAERVRRLLAGELIDVSGIEYDFERWHVALLLRGPGKDVVIDAITSSLDVRRLIVAADDDALWIWLGSKERPGPQVLKAAMPADLSGSLRVGLGEPAQGRAGWRLTHEQARAALSVAVRTSETGVRYADVVLLVAAIHDELTTTSLRQLYLAPLEEDRDRGGVLRETLRAYVSTRGNVTSAAAALAVDRRTVANRLRVAEERIGRTLDQGVGDLDIALQLDRLDRSRIT